MPFSKRALVQYTGLLFCFIVASLFLFDRPQNGFTLKKIKSPFKPSPEWEVPPLSNFEKQSVRFALLQDYSYMASGAQCYAFLSSDGEYVLKFFKTKHLIPKNWLKLLPIPWLSNYRFLKVDKRKAQHKELFSSYKMAYEELRKETGVEFIHLNKTKDLNVRMKIYDKNHRAYLINLDDYEFVLQKKAETVADRIVFLMENKQHEKAVDNLTGLLTQIILQCKNGYIDCDSGVSYNYGFIGDEVVHFDFGRIIKDPSANDPAFYQREILRVAKKLERWCDTHYPQLTPILEEVVDAMMDPSLAM